MALRPACVCHSHRVCHAPCFQVWSLWASCHWGPLCKINGRQRRAKKSEQLPLSPPGGEGPLHLLHQPRYVFLLIYFCCQRLFVTISVVFCLLVPPLHFSTLALYCFSALAPVSVPLSISRSRAAQHVKWAVSPDEEASLHTNGLSHSASRVGPR